MSPTTAGSLALAAVFAAGAVPKLLGVRTARAFATRLGLDYALFRVVGVAELSGALGLVAGVVLATWVGAAAATGLTLLAVSGTGAHFRAHEPVKAYLPALFLGGCTAVLAVALW